MSKINLIIPLVNSIYIDDVPYFIKIVGDKMIIDWSLKSIIIPDYSNIYIYC